MENKYYVYTLAYPDGTVFYVGKGQDDRIHDHEAQARQGYKSKKCNIIRKIWNESGQIAKQKVAFLKVSKRHTNLNSISFYSSEKIILQIYVTEVRVGSVPAQDGTCNAST